MLLFKKRPEDDLRALYPRPIVVPKKFPKPQCFLIRQEPQDFALNCCGDCAWRLECDPLAYRDNKA